MKREASFKTRFIIFITLFMTAVLALVTVIFAKSSVNFTVKIFSNSGIPLIRSAGRLIDGDKFEALAKSLDEEDPYYEETRVRLFSLKNTSSARYLYTMAPKSGTNWVYVIDGSCAPSDTENFSALGDEEDIASYGRAPYQALETGEIVVSGLEEQDEWGWTVTIYSPIYNSSRKAVGFVAADYDARDVVSMLRKTLTRISLLMICVIITAILCITVFMGSFIKRIVKVTEAMDMISNGEGDLTLHLDDSATDEIGRLAKSSNAVTERVRDIVHNLKQSMDKITDNGHNLDKLTDDTILSIGDATGGIKVINSQAKDQTASMEAINENVQIVEDSLHTLDGRLSEQSEAIISSSTAIEQMSSNIASINESVNKISDEYTRLVSAAKDGSKIQKTVGEKIDAIVEQSVRLTEANAAISNIAEQTNLLAMNAAIEAAHAGESGKGFAVVAGEIRQLAATSATQSNAIKELINNINDGVNAIVGANAMSDQSFRDIEGKIETIQTFMLQIKNGMNEQNAGTQSILQKIGIINSSSKSIQDVNETIRKESTNLFTGIEDMRKQTASILDTAITASASLAVIQKSAEDTDLAAKENLAVSQNVKQLVMKFKTE